MTLLLASTPQLWIVMRETKDGIWDSSIFFLWRHSNNNLERILTWCDAFVVDNNSESEEDCESKKSERYYFPLLETLQFSWLSTYHWFTSLSVTIFARFPSVMTCLPLIWLTNLSPSQSSSFFVWRIEEEGLLSLPTYTLKHTKRIGKICPNWGKQSWPLSQYINFFFLCSFTRITFPPNIKI